MDTVPTDEEMVLPGKASTPAQLEAWLNLPDGESIDGEIALKLLTEELACYRKLKA